MNSRTLKLSALLLLAIIAVPLVGTAEEKSSTTPLTVFTNLRIIDGTGKPAVENGVLAIENGRILAAGALDAGEWTSRAGAKVIDAKGLTAIPGLISDHSHVGLVKDGKFASSYYTRENVEADLAKYAGFGVTTVMSLGMNKDLLFQIRDEQRAGKVGGAKVLSAGTGIGYQEGAPPFDLPSIQLQRVTNVDEARAAVQAAAENKVDMIKLWTDTFFGKTKRMPPEILAAIVEEAHRAKLKVAAHVFFLDDGKVLLRDGLDVVAHSIRDRPVDEEFITLMKQKGAAYLPTLSLDETQFVYAEQPVWMTSPAFLAAADPGLVEKWKSEKYAQQIAANPDTPKNRAAFAMAKQNLRTVHDAGILIGFGTDSGANPNRLAGWGEHRELELYVAAGLTPLEAITCATRNAAEILGLLEDRGTLETGKRADFILLSADPLADIRNTTQIASIYHDGEAISPAFSPEVKAASPSTPR